MSGKRETLAPKFKRPIPTFLDLTTRDYIFDVLRGKDDVDQPKNTPQMK